MNQEVPDLLEAILAKLNAGLSTTIDATTLAKEAKQDAGNTSLASLDTKTPAKGAATIANSRPVNIATDQIVPVSATALPLPAGAATSAIQATQQTSLTAIAGSVAAPPLPSGGATGAKQDTGNTSLASIDTKFGTAAAAADAEVNSTTTTLERSRLFGLNAAGTWDRIRAGLTTISNVFTGILNTMPWAIYHLTPVIRTDGQGGPLETAADGSLRVAEQNAPLYENNVDAVASVHDRPVGSAGYNAIPFDLGVKAGAGCLKATPGNLYVAHFTNGAATAQAIALVNKASAAASGDIALCHFYIPPLSTLRIEYKFGKRFTLGIAWAQVSNYGVASMTVAGTDISCSAECG